MPKNFWKIISLILLILVLASFGLKQKIAFTWNFDIFLVSFLIIPLFLSFSEFIFFEIFLIWLLGAIYSFHFSEFFLLGALPVFAFVFKSIFSWRSWAEPFLVGFLGLFGFYILSGKLAFWSFGAAFLNIGVTAAFIWILYLTLRKVFKS